MFRKNLTLNTNVVVVFSGYNETKYKNSVTVGFARGNFASNYSTVRESALKGANRLRASNTVARNETTRSKGCCLSS